MADRNLIPAETWAQIHAAAVAGRVLLGAVATWVDRYANPAYVAWCDALSVLSDDVADELRDEVYGDPDYDVAGVASALETVAGSVQDGLSCEPDELRRWAGELPPDVWTATGNPEDRREPLGREAALEAENASLRRALESLGAAALTAAEDRTPPSRPERDRQEGGDDG